MSSFAGFNTGLSGLMSHQRALEVASNNIANLNTVGYTRQRAELVSNDPAGRAGVFSGTAKFNGGVSIDRIQRLGDVHMEARVREHTAEAGKQGSVHEAWKLAEATINEPSEKGMSEALARFFNDFSEVGNQTNVMAAKSVLYEDARALVADINTAATKVETAWRDMRTKVEGLVVEVNSASQSIAELNDRILTAEVQGLPTGVLVDKREELLVELSDKIGATAQFKENGSVDVIVGGHTLVTGQNSFPVRVEGSLSVQTLAKYTPGDAMTENTGPVRIVWDKTNTVMQVDSGKIGGYLQGLDSSNSGGALPTMAAKYNELAMDVADTVNSILTGGARTDGTNPDDPTNGVMWVEGKPYAAEANTREQILAMKLEDRPVLSENDLNARLTAMGDRKPMFEFYGDGTPSAANMRVSTRMASGADISVRGFPDANGEKGPLDATLGDQITKAGMERRGVSDRWSDSVIDVGVQTRSATRRAEATEDTRDNAVNQLSAKTGVNLDEEVMTLMAVQKAYAGAARVITTLDEMFNSLLAMGA